MKIKLIHSAQIVNGKKVDQHPPGTKLPNVDEEQALRLIRNGYAVADEPTKGAEDDDAGGEGGEGGTGTGTGTGGAGAGGTGS